MKSISHSPVIRKRVVEKIGSFIFTGESQDPLALESEPKWKIERQIPVGSKTTSDFVGSDNFDQVFSNKENIFPPAPFLNSFSTLFDGVDGEARTGLAEEENLRFENNQPFSVSFMIKSFSVAATQSILDKQKSDDGTFRGWGVICSAERIRFIMRSNQLTNDRLIVDSNQVSTGGEWEHWVITYDGSLLADGVEMYKGGAQNPQLLVVADLLNGTTISNERFRVGRRSGQSIPFDGNIDQVTIWSKELSAAEAAEAYNIDFLDRGDILGHSASNSIISHWRMGDNQLFPLIPDQVGGNDLTVINLDPSAFVEDVP